jgi:hypothetical protein
VHNTAASLNRVGFEGYISEVHPYVPDCYNVGRTPDEVRESHYSHERDLELVAEEGKPVTYKMVTLKEPYDGVPAGFKTFIVSEYASGYRVAAPLYPQWVPKEFCEVTEVDTFTHPDPVLREWGVFDTEYKTLDGRVLGEYFLDLFKHYPEVSSTFIHQRLAAFSPQKSKLVPGQISVYQNFLKMEADRRTSLKVGRALKQMFPELKDASVERLVDQYRKDHPCEPLQVKVGSEGKDFKHAYAHTQSKMENPYTTSSRKSLANSCMRTEYSHLPIHPTEIYASGEFKIYWAETSTGTISSRCVVWSPEGRKPQAGPIYGVSEDALDAIQSELDKVEAVVFPSSNWVGAKLLRVEHKGDLIGPYIDGERDIDEVDDEFLKIVRENQGDYIAENTGGYLNKQNKQCCDHCGDELDEDDVYNTPDIEFYCESCFNEHYFTCAYDGEYYSVDDMQTVYYKSRWGTNNESVYEDNLDSYGAVWCKHEGEYWKDDWVVTNTYDGEAVSQGYCDRNYTLCELSDLYYPDEELFGKTVCGKNATVEALLENGYTENESGEWEIKEEKAT